MIYAHKGEREKEKGGKITKGSRCMKCLPFSENAPVMISVMASSDGIVLCQKKNILFVIKDWKFCGGSTKRHNNVTQPPPPPPQRVIYMQ